jgi:hypothetical protein
MSHVPTSGKTERLSGRMQLMGFALGLALAALLLAGTYVLVWLAKEHPEGNQPPPDSTVLFWAAAAGFVGGAGRSLFRFIWEVGGCAEEQPSDYLNRWFLYLVKPVMGIAGGLFFFLGVNLGLVGLFSDHGPALKFLQVCLTAIMGGAFFENVFAILSGAMPKTGTRHDASE